MRKVTQYLFLIPLSVFVAFLGYQLGYTVIRPIVTWRTETFGGLHRNDNGYALSPHLSQLGLREKGHDTDGDGHIDQWQILVPKDQHSVLCKVSTGTSAHPCTETSISAMRHSGLNDHISLIDGNNDGDADSIEVTLGWSPASVPYISYSDYDADGDWDAEFLTGKTAIESIRLRMGKMWRSVENASTNADLAFRDISNKRIVYRFHEGEWVADSQ